MYIVKIDYDFFSGFGDFYRPDYEIFEPVLETNVNAVGYFTFVIYPGHPFYNEIDQPKKIISVIRKNENEPLFIGRVSEIEMGFYNEKTVTCESELAFLLDSVKVNFSAVRSYRADYWLDDILKSHNSNYGRPEIYSENIGRKFEAGYVSKSIASKAVTPEYEDYQGTYTTLDVIMKLLINKFGGILKLRHEGQKNYIDWFDESELKTCSQKIEFGSNLIDLNNNIRFNEIVTAIRPVGENIQHGEAYDPVNLRAFDASKYIAGNDVKQVIDSGMTPKLFLCLRTAHCFRVHYITSLEFF